MSALNVRIVEVDYGHPAHAADLVLLLDAYARDPAGGAEPLTSTVMQQLPSALAARPQAFSVLAYVGEHAAGLVNCLEGFSTFKCQPLVNVHDVVVLEAYRGLGLAQAMLARVEGLARARGACKLTLEVLSGNTSARGLYTKLGFAPYQLDPQWGQAEFMQKWL